MAIFAIGVDMVEIGRIGRLVERYGDHFLKRVFTDKEIDYCRRQAGFGSYAARFAAKEAVLKATGLGLRDGLGWTDIETVNDEMGKPAVRLHGKAARLLAGKTILISLSHTQRNAIAMVVVQ